MPVTVSILSPFTLKSYYPRGYYRMDIPYETKAYHAVSLDEVHSANRPILLDTVAGKTEEVWFSGDHSAVGGGHIIPYANIPTVSDDALQYIVQRARQNGFEFTSSFIEKLENQKQSNVVSAVHNQSRHDIPVKFREARTVVVKTKEDILDDLPLVHESVVDRIRQHGYCPIGLIPFSVIKSVQRNGTIATVDINEDKTYHEQQRSRAISRKLPTKFSPNAKTNTPSKKTRNGRSGGFTPAYNRRRETPQGRTFHTHPKHTKVTTLQMPSVDPKKTLRR